MNKRIAELEALVGRAQGLFAKRQLSGTLLPPEAEWEADAERAMVTGPKDDAFDREIAKMEQEVGPLPEGYVPPGYDASLLGDSPEPDALLRKVAQEAWGKGFDEGHAAGMGEYSYRPALTNDEADTIITEAKQAVSLDFDSTQESSDD